MLKIIVFLVVTMVATSLSWGQIYTRTSLGDSVDKASMKLLKETYEASADKNIVVSPLGVFLLLSLYASASEGDIRDEIMKLFSYTAYNDLSESQIGLIERFTSMDPSYLSLASKMFVSDKYSLEEAFSETARSYKNEVDNINFEDQESAVNIMNEWEYGFEESAKFRRNLNSESQLFTVTHCMSIEHSRRFQSTSFKFDKFYDSYNCINNLRRTSKTEPEQTTASKHTQGKINHPVAKSDITPTTVLALLNVIFFKGHWQVSFNANKTKDQDFYTANAKFVKKPMMHLLQSLSYHVDKDIGARMIELPYKESKFRMIVVLPDEVEGLPEVVRKLSEKGLLEDVFRLYPAGAKVDLEMPKFEIKSKHDLNNILPKVGVASIFDKASRGIVKGAGVRVDKAFQEAFVTVDEEGATAGAFTGAFLVKKSFPRKLPQYVPFKMDHPFLFAILHDDIILFAGTYAH